MHYLSHKYIHTKEIDAVWAIDYMSTAMLIECVHTHENNQTSAVTLPWQSVAKNFMFEAIVKKLIMWKQRSISSCCALTTSPWRPCMACLVFVWGGGHYVNYCVAFAVTLPLRAVARNISNSGSWATPIWSALQECLGTWESLRVREYAFLIPRWCSWKFCVQTLMRIHASCLHVAPCLDTSG